MAQFPDPFRLYTMSKKEDTPLSRPERRRILREKRANALGTAEQKTPKSGKGGQRKLVVGISLLLALCAVAALVKGGKLWIHSPTWIVVVGWIGAALFGWVGLALWVKYKSSFQFGAGWAFRFAVAFTLGIAVGYTYSHMIRQAGENVQMSQIKQAHASVIEMTGQWDGSSWKGEKCQQFESGAEKLAENIIGKDLPPTGVSFRLLLAVSQVGYQAGCQVDFQQQIKALVDEDDRWKKSAPWQYNTLRIWANYNGWPRVGTGCLWEVKRAQVDGNERLAKQIEKSCEPKLATKKLEPWNPNQLTKRNMQKIEAENQALEELGQERENETVKKLERIIQPAN